LLGTEPGRAADPNALANPEVLEHFGDFRGEARPDAPRLLKETGSSQ
jgi:hypothetical protein